MSIIHEQDHLVEISLSKRSHGPQACKCLAQSKTHIPVVHLVDLVEPKGAKQGGARGEFPTQSSQIVGWQHQGTEQMRLTMLPQPWLKHVISLSLSCSTTTKHADA